MWCPPDYTAFFNIDHELRRILDADAAFDMVLHVRDRIDPNRSDILSIEHAKKHVLHSCIHEFFSNCPSFSVFSPGGVCLQISPAMANHHWLPELGWAYSFIDQETGTVSLGQFERVHSKASAKLEEMRANLDEIDANEEAYWEFLNLAWIEDEVAFVRPFKNFDGWSLGCRLEDTPSHVDFKCLDFDDFDAYSAYRPDNLKNAIIESFDNGLIRSKEKLWKGVFPQENREAFRRAWAEAALERPNLSKRGPK